MTTSNVNAYGGEEKTAVAALAEMTEQARSNPKTIIEAIWDELAPADRRVLGRAAISHLAIKSYAAGLANGVWGRVDDVLAVRNNWGFDVSELKVPVKLWHGTDDLFSPPDHTLALARAIGRNAITEMVPGQSHFSAIDVQHSAILQLRPGTDFESPLIP